jgi:ubiquinone/menaquinone biosynthesis C-methylase UbiE
VKHGDFTELAKTYANRPGYSIPVLRALAGHVGAARPGFACVDIGAGTGKLTECLLEAGVPVVAAVEPNDAMRAEGERAVPSVAWRAGSAEQTGLADGSADWLLMGSSFHWTDAPRALAELRRVLRPGGHFTATWNPRAVEKSALETRVEARLAGIGPEIKRVSSGSAKNMAGVEEKLLAGGLFTDVIFMEAPHVVVMSRERYRGVWRSVNDIQVQLGPERFAQFLRAVDEETEAEPEITVQYRTRAWTVRRRD